MGLGGHTNYSGTRFSSEGAINFELLNQRRAFFISWCYSALKWYRSTNKKLSTNAWGSSPESNPTHLVCASTYSTSPMTWGFPDASRGGPISNISRTLAIMSQRLASARYRPGQILCSTLMSQRGRWLLCVDNIPSPKAKDNRTWIVVVQAVQYFETVTFQLNRFLSESLWVEFIGFRVVTRIIHHIATIEWERRIICELYTHRIFGTIVEPAGMRIPRYSSSSMTAWGMPLKSQYKLTRAYDGEYSHNGKGGLTLRYERVR